MKRRVIISELAQRDTRQARQWYMAKDRDLGGRFLSDVKGTVAKAAAFPEAFPEAEPEIRWVLCENFPYKVFYTIEQEQIVILAVYHTSRDPERWNDPSR